MSKFDPIYKIEYKDRIFDRISQLDKRVSEILVDEILSEADIMLESLGECESPIEQLLYITLKPKIDFLEGFLDAVIFESQYKIAVDKKKSYRVDFYVSCLTNDGKNYEFAIECDGHDFHEKTKEQAAKDKARERELKKKGIDVIRFTGSEIWKNPFYCAKDVFDIIWKTIGLK